MASLVDVERHLRRTGLAETRFGRIVANDPRLVGDMRRGRRIGPALDAKIQATIGEVHA